MSEALVRGSRGGTIDLTPRKALNLENKDFRTIVKRMANVRKQFESTEKMIRSVFGLEGNIAKRWLSKSLNRAIPKRWREKFPDTVITFIAEDQDLIVFTEHRMRSQITEAQSCVKDLGDTAKGMKVAIRGQVAELKQARGEERWDAKRLQQLKNEKAGIKVDPEVEELLDDKLNILSPEQREKLREKYLDQLDSNLANQEAICDDLILRTLACLEMFDLLVTQYLDFVTVQKPLILIRDSSKSLLNDSQAMYAARAVITETYRDAMRAMDVAFDAAKMVEMYSIGPEFRKLCEDGQRHLVHKLKELDQAQGKLLTTRGSPKMLSGKTDAPLETENQIDERNTRDNVLITSSVLAEK